MRRCGRPIKTARHDDKHNCHRPHLAALVNAHSAQVAASTSARRAVARPRGLSRAIAGNGCGGGHGGPAVGTSGLPRTPPAAASDPRPQPGALAGCSLVHAVSHVPLIVLAPIYHADGSTLIVLPLFVAAGSYFGDLRLPSDSGWPAAIAHAVHNAAWGTHGHRDASANRYCPRRSTVAKSPLEVTPSLVKTLCRWYSTVRLLRNSFAAMSGLLTPTLAKRAICNS
jgi:hypothetical protein